MAFLHLLLLLLLLLPATTAQGPDPAAAAAAASSASSSKFSIYSTSVQSGPSAAAAGLVSRPPWLNPQATTSDDPTIRGKRLLPGSRPAQGAAIKPSTASAAGQPAAAAATKPRPGRRFIVQLKTPSAAAAVGPTILPIPAAAAAAAAAGVDDSATSATDAGSTAARGTRTDRITPQAAAAAAAVQGQSAAVAAAAGVTAQVTHRYSYALSGFAVQNPTPGQLAALAADPRVASVVEDRRLSISTYTTPQFLGLASSGKGRRGSYYDKRAPSTNKGVWSQLGGVEGYNGAGENVVIGVIDTGIWMSNHSCFSDSRYWLLGNSWKQDYRQLQDWRGMCAVGTGSTAECNDKVVGCRYFTASWGGDDALLSVFTGESLSCRDIDGHGSHTASTAAGNYGGSSGGAPAGAVLSGMAPRSRLAIYKAFWGLGGSAYGADVAAAVEAAIIDNVDVINYSASSSSDTFRGVEMEAFMNAARAGIFVSAAANNNGPEPSVHAVSPWMTSVAASTHDRILEADLTLGSGTVLTGTGAQLAPLGPLPLVYAASLADGNTTTAALCAPDSLNTSVLAKYGQQVIVACDRGGEFWLSDKISEVLRIGAAGMLLFNVPNGDTNQYYVDFGLPYAHLTAAQRETVLAYLRSSGKAATGTLSAARTKTGVTAPAMADFSSRGPIPMASAVVMKPDVTAPGVSVYAAYTGREGILYAYLSGTSMATPHIAGIAALIKDKYPRWSPMAIKSAIMTTAYTLTRSGTTGQPFGTALDYGAGHVDVAKALDPALVFDSSITDWQRFLCDVEPFPGDNCTTLCAADPRTSTAAATVPAADAAIPTVPLVTTAPAAAPAAAAAAAAAATQPAITQESGPASLVQPQHRQPRPSPSPAPVASPPPAIRPCDAFNFNGPWIAGEVAGSLTVVRTLTSVLPSWSKSSRVVFTGQGSADAGSAFEVVLSPASFRPKEKQPQVVTITVRATAGTVLNKYQFGQVVWRSSQGHSVRIPISIRFSDFVAPASVRPALRMPSFQHRIRLAADTATTVSIANIGMTPATVTKLRVEPTTGTTLNATGVARLDITVLAGNAYFGIGIFSEDVPYGVDLDLYLYQGDVQLGRSIAADSTEYLEAIKGLPAGSYTAYVFPYNLDFEAFVDAYLHVWMLPAAGQGPMQVSPSSLKVTPGDMGCCPVTLSFDGLDFESGRRYVGALSYSRADGKPTTVDRTMVYLL